MSGIAVAKLGGSHAFSDTLPAWLAALEGCAGKLVLVCGGGPFADAVRAAQPRMGFDDAAADAMALLAMEQYAVALAATGRRFVVAGSRAAIRTALRAGKVPIWAPRRMVTTARRVPASIPPSWEVTSDSLAAWLAGELAAQRLFLIKRVVVADPCPTAEALVEAGMVDRAFPRFLAASGAQAFLLGPSDLQGFPLALAAGTTIGRPIGLVATPAPIHHGGA